MRAALGSQCMFVTLQWCNVIFLLVTIHAYMHATSFNTDCLGRVAWTSIHFLTIRSLIQYTIDKHQGRNILRRMGSRRKGSSLWMNLPREGIPSLFELGSDISHILHYMPYHLQIFSSNPIDVLIISVTIYLFIHLFIKNICVCNAQLMQKAQQRRYKTVAAIWTKKFSIPSGNSWTRESVLLEQGAENSKPPGLPLGKPAGQMSQFVTIALFS